MIIMMRLVNAIMSGMAVFNFWERKMLLGTIWLVGAFILMGVLYGKK